MAKKSIRKNRSVRKQMQMREEWAKRKEKADAETDKELKLILGCLAAATAMLVTILFFA
jgi:Fe-S oxidoreductase